MVSLNLSHSVKRRGKRGDGGVITCGETPAQTSALGGQGVPELRAGAAVSPATSLRGGGRSQRAHFPRSRPGRALPLPSERRRCACAGAAGPSARRRLCDAPARAGDARAARGGRRVVGRQGRGVRRRRLGPRAGGRTARGAPPPGGRARARSGGGRRDRGGNEGKGETRERERRPSARARG